MTQAQRIKDYIRQFGSITPLDAFRDLGITKLATRVSEMRAAGEQIESDWMEVENRFGEKVKFKRYRLNG